jgi:formylglycine-generating enzyme required for sulfatase activity
VGGRLPTEAEWEKAASWDLETQTKFVYPWGNSEPTSSLLNYNGNVGFTTPVGAYPDGVSPYDLADMAGNVWEWTSSSYKSYPYDATDGREDMSAPRARVIRGGSYSPNDDYYTVGSADRAGVDPAERGFNIGFRCSRDTSP